MSNARLQTPGAAHDSSRRAWRAAHKPAAYAGSHDRTLLKASYRIQTAGSADNENNTDTHRSGAGHHPHVFIAQRLRFGAGRRRVAVAHRRATTRRDPHRRRVRPRDRELPAHWHRRG
ncbi:protein of unknown function [Thauera humireducens]|nr:protein of unknown function [Thauera humireducens]